MNIIIKKASKADFGKILEIKKSANIYNFEKKQFVVAKIEDELIGFGRIFKHKNSGKSEIGSLYVFPKYRKQKIGYKIMDFLIKNSKENEFFIDIDKELLHYYQNFGFKLLQNPEKFQLEKIKEIYDFYGDFYNENKILEESYFMKFEK